MEICKKPYGFLYKSSFYAKKQVAFCIKCKKRVAFCIFMIEIVKMLHFPEENKGFSQSMQTVKKNENLEKMQKQLVAFYIKCKKGNQLLVPVTFLPKPPKSRSPFENERFFRVHCRP